MNETCGCYAGIEAVTPERIANRPGLAALAYCVGTHARFFETMLAQLSRMPLHIATDQRDPSGESITETIYPLHSLSTRSRDDPSVALLDAWATVADVLSFYQERIANEGYLRTATERRSVLEIGRLVGYTPLPGVAATGYLAYTLDQGAAVTITTGSKVQSVPGPGELPQTFETSEDLDARGAWNTLPIRQTRALDTAALAARINGASSTLYVNGTTSGLRPNDPLLADFGSRQIVYRVLAVTPDAAANRTAVTLRPWQTSAAQPGLVGAAMQALRELIARYTDLPAFDVPPTSIIARRAFEKLEQLRTISMQGARGDELHNLLENETLPALRDERAKAERTTSLPLQNWLNRMVPELEELSTRLEERREAAETDPAGGSSSNGSNGRAATTIGDALAALAKPLVVQPANSLRLERSVAATFSARSDTLPGLLTTLRPELAPVLYQAWRNVPATPPPTLRVYALRGRASAFGHNAPPEPVKDEGGVIIGTREWTLFKQFGDNESEPTEQPDVIALDSSYPTIVPESWIVLERPEERSRPPAQRLIVSRVVGVREASRADYGLTGKCTFVQLDQPWLDLGDDDEDGDSFAVIRGTAVYTQSELLELVEAPIDPVAEPICGGEVVLEHLYDGLTPGRWLLISGERTDVYGQARDAEGGTAPSARIGGVLATELVMLGGVRQEFDAQEAGARTRTTLVLAQPLAYCYKRDTVKIYGNVVKATHGETRNDVLGSGDGSMPNQSFDLKQKPLTYVSAATSSGVASTLVAYVDGVRWHAADSMVGLAPTDRRFVTTTGDDDTTRVIFGNGQIGARLPSGQENIAATYRFGIGKIGNLKAAQLTLLATRPQGVTAVVNPLPATGGADRDGPEQMRRAIPLAVTALDRLVAVQDYADFARTFAGIGKASAAQLTNGRREIVHLTIAGADDIPIDPSSELFKNLRHALRQYGDPFQPFQVAMRRLRLLVIAARVQIGPDYLWENVAPAMRFALLDRFSFARRDLGQDVARSEVLSALQAVDGVVYVDLDILDTVDEQQVAQELTTPSEGGLAATLTLRPYITAHLAQRVLAPTPHLQPAELMFLSPDQPDTLMLSEIAA